jgi:hypothetical protein
LRVTQTVGQPRAKAKSFLNCKFGFTFGSEIQIHFLVVAFFNFLFESGFQQVGFQVLVSLLNKLLFISKVSGWFCRVSKIGFKVFSVRFGQLWF